MRAAQVLYKGDVAGVLTQNNNGTFHFKYHEDWLSDPLKPSISLTLPKIQAEFYSETLFPFFYHLLPEGANKRLVCRTFRIDKDDEFGILLHTSKIDTIGAVTLQRI
ncbi:HipA N-terminal domain-containing protein [Chryseobacterium balustinum]|uniref:Serine/threonine-protein kinase HipA n=1 Tax=Chryseobacterium balustinum TaxID=246 RepID=A0AAX2IR44_9FLAO|nr:HipA N-terminal domain-containing protein [Chryseobacterium balustinum]AZB28399.1 phosphatidylinositol kinase [Chryseobacterium balustinum]SKC04361.1 serine/threonine-protein kinase HipA [Chryseobacterium balustinum]SQA92648.1 Serine/threonine-protein kinase HipA [Chryseobacterium balustinum]